MKSHKIAYVSNAQNLLAAAAPRPDSLYGAYDAPQTP